MDKKKKERIEKHIKALEKSYDNVISVLQEDVEKDKETGKVKLKDTQKRLFSEGVRATAETATFLLDLMNQKQAELDGEKEDAGKNTDTSKAEKKAAKTNVSHPLSKHLD